MPRIPRVEPDNTQPITLEERVPYLLDAATEAFDMHYLVFTTSVHTTAAICDYLDERATSDDGVTVVATTSADDATTRRDAQEALNVAPVRLAALDDVRTELRTHDEPARSLLEIASAVDADEILITAHDGLDDGSSSVGSNARELLETASLPVVVVPVPDA